MNFLFVAFDFPPAVGGIQTRAENYVKNLIRMGHHVTVIHILHPEVIKSHFSKNASPESLHEIFFGARVFRYPSSIRKLFEIFFKTVKDMRKNHVDVIHIISGANTPIGLLFLFYGKIKGIKTGVSFYGKDILDSHHVYRLLQRIAMLTANRMGVNSKATLNLTPKIFRKKALILYPGVDTVIPHFHVKTSRSEKIVLFVGRLVQRKGADDLMRAFKLLLGDVPQAKLVIVGDGPQRENLHALAERLEIKDKVEFTGTLRGEKLYRRYAECDVFVMPSKRLVHDVEGFGMVFLEAALFKKPAVGTWSGGIPEAVIDGKTGLLVKPEDVEALKNALRLLLTNEELARKLGENAYKRVMAEFTWEKATIKFLKMYENINAP